MLSVNTAIITPHQLTTDDSYSLSRGTPAVAGQDGGGLKHTRSTCLLRNTVTMAEKTQLKTAML